MSDIQLYTAAEVAEVLRLHPQVVQRKLQAGEIPGYRLGREWRVERSQLREWLEQHSNQRDPLDRFFDKRGRLDRYPSDRETRVAVLHRVAADLDRHRTYAEAELNDILRTFSDDVSTLRRELVGAKVLIRTKDGIYKVATSTRRPS